MKNDMRRTPEWTESEFHILVTNSGMFDSELKSELPRRSIGAIGAVRAGVHAYHVGNDSTMLSQMMTAYLSRHHSHIKCAKCGMIF